MTAANLTLQYSDFANAVSDFLGYGLEYPTTGDNNKRVDRIVQSGLREFYRAYHWSFLQPQHFTLSLADEGTSVTLPDDFGGLAGDVSISTSETDTLIRVVGEQWLRQRRQLDSTTQGRPQYCALYTTAAPAGAVLGQVWTLEVWPKANAGYTLGVSYSKNPTKIDGTTNKFPLGGQAHCETMKEFMLAAAELSGDDELGNHTLKAESLLKSSKEHDRRFFGSNSLGMMRDPNAARIKTRTFTWSRG